MVTLANGAASVRLDAAVHLASGRVGGIVCEERFLDGIYGWQDRGLANVEIFLNDGTSKDSAFTDSAGRYQFLDLTPDNYQVELPRQPGKLFLPDRVPAPQPTTHPFYYMNMVNFMGQTNVFPMWEEHLDRVTACVYTPANSGSATPTNGGGVGSDGNTAAGAAVSANASSTAIQIPPGSVMTTTAVSLPPSIYT